jgi:hypothetical protein
MSPRSVRSGPSFERLQQSPMRLLITFEERLASLEQ